MRRIAQRLLVDVLITLACSNCCHFSKEFAEKLGVNPPPTCRPSRPVKRGTGLTLCLSGLNRFAAMGDKSLAKLKQLRGNLYVIAGKMKRGIQKAAKASARWAADARIARKFRTLYIGLASEASYTFEIK